MVLHRTQVPKEKGKRKKQLGLSIHGTYLVVQVSLLSCISIAYAVLAPLRR